MAKRAVRHQPGAALLVREETVGTNRRLRRYDYEQGEAVKSDIGYVRNLVEAGLDGITSGWKASGDRAFAPSLMSAVVPAAVGCGIGVLSTWLMANRRRAGRMVTAGGVIGSTLGFGVGVAWASRRVTGTAIRSAARKVNTVRDAHWLEKHPIAYG